MLQEMLDLMLADQRQGWQLVDSTWRRDPSVEVPGTHATLLSRAPFS
jgi:hypothetical protein